MMNTTIMCLEGYALATYAELLGRTCRLEVRGWEPVAGMMEVGRPCILAAWHGQTHLFYPFVKAHLDLNRLAMIVVEDHRETVLSTFAQVIGAQTYPISMSDSTLAGARRMIALVNALRSGKFSYITPDGPDGPPRVAKGGLAFLATRAEARVIPVGAYSRTCFRIPRWDRYALPLPFSHIRVVIGQPIQARRDMDRNELLEQVSRRMSESQDLAEEK